MWGVDCPELSASHIYNSRGVIMFDRKKYRLLNKKRLTEAKKKEYRKNIERYRLYSKEYHKKNKIKHNEQSHQNYIRNKPRYRNTVKKTRGRQKEKVLAYYTNGSFTCNKCGFSDKRALCVDHVNDNGAIERKTIKGSGIYAYIIRKKYPKDYQVLCANCNMIKEMERRKT